MGGPLGVGGDHGGPLGVGGDHGGPTWVCVVWEVTMRELHGCV